MTEFEDKYAAPPIKNLNFDQFHPLFHSIFSDECRSYYGGRRQHLTCLWVYKWDVHTKVRRPLCWIGQHDWSVMWYPRDRTRSVHCHRCFKKANLEQTQQALDESDAREFYPPGWMHPRKEN
jgi:hypothetical protein